MRQLLSGITVVELAEGIAGSYCGKLFADLGADVVKVESPSGDELRHRTSTARGPDGLFRGGAFLHANTNKRSTVIDPATAEGRARVRLLLLRRSQLVIESSGRSDLDSWGLTWDGIHEDSPGLSVVSISGFGATGPYAGYRWDDLIVQAVSGAMVHGGTDEGPVRLPGHLGLHVVASMAALASHSHGTREPRSIRSPRPSARSRWWRPPPRDAGPSWNVRPPKHWRRSRRARRPCCRSSTGVGFRDRAS